MDSILKNALNTTKLIAKGNICEGTISHGEAYDTDIGAVFVKCNSSQQARLLYEGELEALKAVAATRTVSVPKPIKVLDKPDGGACLVTQHLDMRVLHNYSARLGESVARLHLHNGSLGEARDPGHVDKFGFHTTTFHRLIPQDNSWKDDWATFFVENRLEPEFRILQEKKKDLEASDLWARLRDKIPSFFDDVEIKPSLIHGDLWGGNVGETWAHPVVFDLASAFYGHHEYDIATSILWGGFTPIFYNAYRQIIPKAPGFDKRKKLYRLFQFLHHWNHLKGTVDYRDVVVNMMKQLLQ